jgi:hypothetical protein
VKLRVWLVAVCAAWAGTAAGVDLLTASARNAPAPLATPVPYTGAELVHPSVVFQEGGWNGFPYWMAVTPYAHSDAQFENPSLYCSLDGQAWQTPKGLANPLVPKPKLARRYNSDCHLVLGPEGTLHLFYRAAGADRNDTLYLISSRDGRHWSSPQTVLDVDLADERELSPAVFFDAVLWQMYYVDSSAYPFVIRRRTAKRPEGPWSLASAVTGIQPPPGHMLWHLDAFRFQGATVLLVNTTATYKTQEGGQLFLAVSPDGLAFTRGPAPVLSFSQGWDSSLYRSCALPILREGRAALAIWYSAWGPDLGWRLGYTEVGKGR